MGSDQPENNWQNAVRAWWRQHASEEVELYIKKREIYGSVDLDVIGNTMLLAHPQLRTEFADEDRMRGRELGVAYYALGKVARIIGAMVEGRMPAYDSWHDLAIYAQMAMLFRKEHQDNPGSK